MKIFEVTQFKKKLVEYDPNRLPPKKNFGAGVGPGVQPQYTATPRMKGTPAPGAAPRLPAPGANAVTRTAPAPELQTIDAPARLTGPKAAKQIGMNDPNVIDVDAKVKPDTATAPTPATAPATAPTPATAPAAGAGAFGQMAQQLAGGKPPNTMANAPVSASNTAKPGNPNLAQPAAAPASEPVAAAPAPSTPGVKGSRVYNTLGSLGDVLMQQQAAAAGISQPDFTKYNPYGDKRAEASKAAAPLISQLARAEQANWNKSIADALKQYKVASQQLLPTPARQALQTSLTNRINQTLLQNSLGKDPGKLSSYVDDDNQQEAAAQVAKLQAAKQKILNFDTPANTAAQTQAWQDIAQATYDMRSLLQFHSKGFIDSRMPQVKSDANGVLYVGKTPISNSQIGADIKYLLDSKTINGMPPKITKLPSGQFALNDDYILDPTKPAERELIRIIQTQPA